MTCSRNDIILLPIPFTDLTSRKVRPAIVIGRKGTDLFLVPISSVLSNTDFPLQDWQAAGLNVPSGVKAQLSTIEENWL
jgi:mRNA interferase MazF